LYRSNGQTINQSTVHQKPIFVMKTLVKQLVALGFVAGMLLLASCSQQTVSPQEDAAIRAAATDTCRRN
jgi:hypothetical protein